ncbi:hypothetical protein U91I_03662 [alpha proteobacterium U9-1i]|nr:hypothetical protein U91I_03662 [alpha proteobacterium U9-1i]
MLSAPIRILVIAALCVAGLVGLVVRESMARDNGTEVLMPMEAVDPRSLLSGHFVIISLRESIPVEEPCPTPASETPWIALAPEGEVHRFAGSAPTRDEARQIAPLVVRGAFTCSTPIVSDDPAFPGTAGWIMLDLGIDRFHTNQAEAERIDRILREQRPGEDSRVFAIVSIGEDGRARLKGLVVDGARVELGWT